MLNLLQTEMEKMFKNKKKNKIPFSSVQYSAKNYTLQFNPFHLRESYKGFFLLRSSEVFVKCQIYAASFERRSEVKLGTCAKRKMY